METIEAGQLVFSALVVIGAYAVRSTTGFGSTAVAVPLMTLVLPLQIVVPVVTVLNLLSSVDQSARNWRAILWPELFRILPFVVLGVLIGLYVFSQLDTHVITKGLGIFVIAYAVYALVSAGRPPGAPRRMPWPLAATLSTSGALFSVFGGAAGPFVAVYLNALRIPRDAFRTTITTVLLVILMLRVAGYAGLGLFQADALLALGVALPLMLIGAKLGDVIASRVDQHTFNRIVGAVLLISGAALALK